VGVLYHGLALMGGGSILGGVILGSIGVCIIDREFARASGFAMAGAVLTFFGFMHGEAIGIGQTPVVATSYAIIALVFAACAKFAKVPDVVGQEESHATEGILPEPAE
jgi:AGZA family xanthine/uracil permease-like MFS transporter